MPPPIRVLATTPPTIQRPGLLVIEGGVALRGGADLKRRLLRG